MGERKTKRSCYLGRSRRKCGGEDISPDTGRVEREAVVLTGSESPVDPRSPHQVGGATKAGRAETGSRRRGAQPVNTTRRECGGGGERRSGEKLGFRYDRIARPSIYRRARNVPDIRCEPDVRDLRGQPDTRSSGRPAKKRTSDAFRQSSN